MGKSKSPAKIANPGAPVPVNEADYNYATENYVGWCKECKEFTREQTEPDAEGYDCPKCTQNTVIGAEDALLTGLIEFKEDGVGA